MEINKIVKSIGFPWKKKAVATVTILVNNLEYKGSGDKRKQKEYVQMRKIRNAEKGETQRGKMLKISVIFVVLSLPILTTFLQGK